ISGHSRVLDLAPIEERLREQLSQDARQKIKRARREGILVESVTWADSVDRYYEGHRETYIRTGATPHPRDYFDGIARHLDTRHVALWAARSSEGEIVAFHSDLRVGDGCQYHMGCSMPSALE